MHSVNSATAHTLDKEKIVTKHDQVSNDQDQSNDPIEDSGQLGESLRHVGQGFMTNEDLTASPRTTLDENSAEQRLRDIVETP